MSSGLVGRAAELGVIVDVIDRVRHGTGSSILVTGEAGIGKTRLLRAAREVAMDGGVTVAGGHGWADEGAPPLWPWVQVLRGLVGQLTEPVDAGVGSGDLLRLVPELGRRLAGDGRGQVAPDHESFYLRDAAVSVMAAAARTRPVLVCLDDLHWSDVASVHLATHLAGVVPRLPIGLVVTWRDGEGDDGLLAALEGFRQLAVPLPLAGLDADGCGEVAAARTGARLSTDERRRLHARTGGNPFFVEDLVAFGGLDDGLPHRTRATLVDRFERLPGSARALVELASVLGRRFDTTTLAAAASASPAAVHGAVSAAQRAGLVEPAGPGTYTFRHALLAEAVSSAIEPSRRAALHLACAAAAEQRDGSSHSAADVARHLLAALPHADAERAREAAVRAGREAHDRRAHDDAARWFRRALDRLPPGSSADSERAALLVQLGRSLLAGSGVDEAVGIFEAAEAAASRAGDPVARAEALVWVTEARYRAPGLDVDERTRVLLADAIGELDESQPVLTARAAEQLARLEILVGDGGRALGAADRAASIARSCGHPAAAAAAHGARRWALVGPYSLADKAEASRAMAAPPTDPAARWHWHYWKLLDALEVADPDDAWAQLEASHSMAERLREPFFVSLTMAWDVCLAAMEGRFDDAEAAAEQALAVMDPAGVDPAGVLAQTMLLARERGEVEGYDELLASLAAAIPERSAVYRAILAMIYADQGRVADAAAELGRLAADDFRGVPVNAHWLTALMSCAEACSILDDGAAARTLRPLLLPLRDRSVVAGAGPYLYLGAVAHHCGSLAVTAGDIEAALEDLDLADRIHARLGARPWRARTAFERARAHLRRGAVEDRALAVEAGRAAREQAEALGMKGLLARLDAVATPEADTDRLAGMAFLDGTWEIRFGGASFGLPDSKGLRCLAVLLTRPHADVPVDQLVSVALSEDVDDVERARVNVTRQLRSAIGRIEDHQRELAQHLRTAVRTGRRCGYRPAGNPPLWHVEGLDVTSFAPEERLPGVSRGGVTCDERGSSGSTTATADAGPAD